MENIDHLSHADYHKISTLDMHTGGEPLRIVLEGYPSFEPQPILDIRRELKKNHDHLRKAIMWEPRGHYDMYGLLKVAAERPDSAFGVIFMHNEGYSTMCGHATIAIGRAAVELGWVDSNIFNIDAPCGQLQVLVEPENHTTSFLNVPSFYVGTFKIDLLGFGPIEYDLAYGGAFYAYINCEQLGLSCEASHASEFIKFGKSIKQQIQRTNNQIIHPFLEDLSYLYGCIFIDDHPSPDMHSRNVCIFADGELDRCATGSGVSGRVAIHHSKNELDADERIKIGSIIGTSLEVEIVESLKYGQYDAVIPKVTGKAFYTGRHEFWIDPKDPIKNGFLLK